MSRICLSLTEKSLDNCKKVVQKHIDEIDLIELRADFLDINQLEIIDQFKFNKPTIFTYRKIIDGGLYDGLEESRLKVMELAIKSGNFSYIDLEADLISPTLDTLSREYGLRIIRSFHDFKGVPTDLSKKLVDVKRSEDEIPKAAVMINSTEELLELYREANKILDDEKIILGMGPKGFSTRVLAEKIGSYLTFCSTDGASAAPGHVTPTLLKNCYRFESINRGSAVMGIIGNPVMHTKSPLIHNEGYKKLGLDAVYVPFETDNPKLFMEIAKLLNIKGFSVTVPFKTDIIESLDSVTDSVKMIGACNTVTKINDKWIGENTDYIGFIKPLINRYGSLKGKKVSVIGAGGSAKASLYALIKEGAEVLLLNRTVSKAKELAEIFNIKYSPLNSENIDTIKEYSDVIVQNTNVGMHPLEELDPLDFYNFKGSEFLYDIIYTPDKTKFLLRGELAGCEILNGWQMLLEQGYRQFKLFTGHDYPRTV